MLKREFRRKYPCNPDEGSRRADRNKINILTPKDHKLNNPNYPHIQDIRENYCNVYGYDLSVYMQDWRSIERINPKTKKFYKSKKYQ